MDDNISVNTARLFGSGIHESIIGTRDSDPDLDHLSCFSAYSSCSYSSNVEIKCLDPEPQSSHHAGIEPKKVAIREDRNADGCSMHVRPEEAEERSQNRRPQTRRPPRSRRPVSQPYRPANGPGQAGSANANQNGRSQNARPNIAEERHDVPKVSGKCPNCLALFQTQTCIDCRSAYMTFERRQVTANVGKAEEAQPLANGHVRDIVGLCQLCRNPETLAEKNCLFCAGYICDDCLPVHERFFPLHVTVPAALEITPGYLVNAIARRLASGLRGLHRVCLFVCCCNAQSLK